MMWVIASLLRNHLANTITLDSWRGNETSHLNHFSICAGNMKVALVLRWYFESYFYIFQPIRSCMSWFFYTSIYLFNGLKLNSSNNWTEQSPKSTDITNAKRNRDLYIPFLQPYQRSQHFMGKLAIVVFLTLDVAPCHSLLRSTAAQSPRQWLASSVRMPAASSVGNAPVELRSSSCLFTVSHIRLSRLDTRQAGFSGSINYN